MYKNILKIVGFLMLGVIGALIFNVSFLPYMLASTYFENFQFIKDYKEGKIVVNKTDQVYIQENKAIEDLILKAENSLVTIQSASLGTTSGFIATSDGSIITLASAIPANKKFNVFFQGQPQDVKVLVLDNKNNVALLKIEKNNLQTVGFADSDNIKLGERVFLVAPISQKQDYWIANEGIVREINTDVITTNITEKPTVAGGPLFNVTGQLVGLNFIDQKGNVLAIPINKIRQLLGL